MARTSRTIYVILPFLLSLTTLILTILIFAGNTSTNPLSRPFYFVKADTTNFIAEDIPGISLNLKDWYTIGLWNYCAGNAQSAVPTHCSQPKAFFWFDPLRVWQLTSTPLEEFIGPEVHDALDKYQTATKWLFIAYIAAIASNAATFILSIFAFCGRLGSIFTSLAAIAATVFTCGAAATATVIYLALATFIRSNFAKYNLTANLGTAMFTIVWLAAACSLSASVFWMVSSCCGSGERKEQITRRGTETYQRVPSPMPYQSESYAYLTPQSQWWPGQTQKKYVQDDESDYGYNPAYGQSHRHSYKNSYGNSNRNSYADSSRHSYSHYGDSLEDTYGDPYMNNHGHGHEYSQVGWSESVPLQTYHTYSNSVEQSRGAVSWN